MRELFYLTTAHQTVFSKLTQLQQALLIMALFAYASTGEVLDTTDTLLDVAFTAITSDIDEQPKKLPNRKTKPKEKQPAKDSTPVVLPYSLLLSPPSCDLYQ